MSSLREREREFRSGIQGLRGCRTVISGLYNRDEGLEGANRGCIKVIRVSIRDVGIVE